MMPAHDTIYALASGTGRAGIAVIRVSGPRAAAILTDIAGSRPEPRRAVLRPLKDAAGDLIDRSLILWFPGPRSFTGEDLAELHVHGGFAVIAAVDRRLRELGGRPAEAGEFSRRAFLNGRIDLLQAEGLADLVDAETEAQRHQAVRQSEGALSQIYERWSRRLLETLAMQEATLDFPDEAAEGSIDDEIGERIDQLIAAFSEHLVEGKSAEALRRGIVICVVGEPNVGKSSLVNRLVRDEVSIVSARAGTTRDLVEARLVLAGVPVTLVDTAGLREADDELELEGIRRARVKAENADLILEVVTDEASHPAVAARAIRVVNKVDLQDSDVVAGFGVSALTGYGIPELMAILTDRVRDVAARTSHPAMTKGRHRYCIETARDHLLAARKTALAELKGEELRLAMQALGRLTGRVDVEDLLDVIFSSFCIGK